ncbi:MAG: hypothetical protein WCS51_05170 [Bacilli bacterium]
MKYEEYLSIIKQCRKLKTKQSKIDYLKSVYERTDYDKNGCNEEIVKLLNKLKS